MYLKEIRINGFKSFAEPTSLSLPNGFIAIVGPNGCGKSNIADAIRWVLGEQSSKSLRAGNMQDVIFQGTDSRKPVNLCEVSLLFSECEKDLGTSFSEVEIGRRVIRDGGSQYNINGKACRLRDIQRLFMDTGIGQVSYSFLVQGQIDQILSSNPAERRFIFEEAAGISRYKAQRREALNKLAQVDANLARITDVIDEVSRQIGSLRRQAGKAIRYKIIENRLRHLDLAHNRFRYEDLTDRISALCERSSGLKDRLTDLDHMISETEAILSGKRDQRGESYEKLKRIQQTVYDLRSDKEQADKEAELAEVRIMDFRSRLGKIEDEIKNLSLEEQTLKQQAKGEDQQKTEQLDLFSDSDKTFKERSGAVIEVQEKLIQVENELQQLRQNGLMVESRITRERSQCSSLELDLKTYQVKHANLADEEFRMKNDLDVLHQDIVNLEAVREERLANHGQENEKLDRILQDGEAERGRFREIQSEILVVDREVAQSRAKIALLEDLQNRFEGFSEGTKALLAGKLDPLLPTETIHLLTRLIEVPHKYTKALDQMLGIAVQSVIVSDLEKAGQIIEELRRKKLGRASLKISSFPERTKSIDTRPDFLEPVSIAIGSREHAVESELKTLFSDCYFVENSDTFAQFWQKNPGFDFLLVASLDGVVFDRRGLITGGEGAGLEDSFLQRADAIRALNSDLKRLVRKLEGLKKKADSIQEKLYKIEEKISLKRSRILEIEQELSNLKGQESTARESVRRLDASFEETSLKRLSLEREKGLMEERLGAARDDLNRAERDLLEIRKITDDKESEIKILREDRDRRRDGLADIRLELAERRQRLEVLNRGLRSMEERAGEIGDLRLKYGHEIDDLHERIEGQENIIKNNRGRSSEVEKTLTITQSSLQQTHELLISIENETQSCEEGLRQKRENFKSLNEDVTKLEIELTKRRSESGFILEEIEHRYNLSLESIDWRMHFLLAGEDLPDRIRVDIEEEFLNSKDRKIELPDPSQDEIDGVEVPDWVDINSEVKELRERIYSMGAVNLVAIEEYTDLKERYEFLKEQSDDLWKSKNKLLEAIDEINKTSEDLFTSTFNQVKKNFEYTFDTLFGGGTADLRLIDEEDVLESGIDIIARPPGTRLRNLALLSGGQKTMTAVALLFAIYMVKPSPFCVLDELDAPLDDANIGRFIKMLERFFEYSQFLIITHNKRTIEAADMIYGVTMQEKGVSRIISLKFDREQEEATEISRN